MYFLTFHVNGCYELIFAIAFEISCVFIFSFTPYGKQRRKGKSICYIYISNTEANFNYYHQDLKTNAEGVLSPLPIE